MKRLLALAGVLLACVSAAGCGAGPKDPENEIPVGWLDVPKEGSVLTPGRTMVGGWAVDDTGIAEIRIYFDSRYAGSTTLSVERPDVSKAMAKYARGSDVHGWNAYIDFGMVPGPHTILAQAVDDNGATRDLGTVTVIVPR